MCGVRIQIPSDTGHHMLEHYRTVRRQPKLDGFRNTDMEAISAIDNMTKKKQNATIKYIHIAPPGPPLGRENIAPLYLC